jgi:hypothetical protein
MDHTELVCHILSLLSRIARAERFAAAMSSQEGRAQFLTIIDELQNELDLIHQLAEIRPEDQFQPSRAHKAALSGVLSC